MRSDEHLPELNKIAVILVIDLDDTPWVLSAANLASFRGRDLAISTNNGEWDLGQDFVVLRDRLFIVEFIPGPFEDLNAVVVDVCKDLGSLVT